MNIEGNSTEIVLSISAVRKPRIWPVVLIAAAIFGWQWIRSSLMGRTIIYWWSLFHPGPNGRLSLWQFSRSPDFVIAIYVIVLATEFMILSMFLLASRERFSERLAFRRPRVSALFIAVCVLGCVGLAWLLGWLRFKMQLPSPTLQGLHRFMLECKATRPVSAVFIVVIIGPIFEEMLFRGFIQTRLV